MRFLNKIFRVNRIEKISEFFNKSDSSILEIGTYKGEFSEIIFNKFNPKKLILVDPWTFEADPIYKKSLYGADATLNQESEKNFQNLNKQNLQNLYYEKVLKKFEEQIKNNRVQLIRKKSSQAFKNFENNFFDMIYIDGNHLYKYVLSDILNSLEKIKDDGIIVCDDYKNDKSWFGNGVTKAIRFLKKRKKIKIIEEHNFFSRHNQCIIKKI
jgi:hypothetical protein